MLEYADIMIIAVCYRYSFVYVYCVSIVEFVFTFNISLENHNKRRQGMFDLFMLFLLHIQKEMLFSLYVV